MISEEGSAPTRVVAHRGASAAHPPGNTLEAFAAAGPLGADGVELDVRRTCDGALVVHHDAHLPDGRAIVMLTADAVPGWVPNLTEALEVCADLHVNIEIKNDPGDPDWDEARGVATEVAKAVEGRPHETLSVTSFDLGSIDRIRAVDPELSTGLLVFDLATWPKAPEIAAVHGHRGLNPWDPFVTAELIEECHALGLEINPWTVDDPTRLRELLALGVDGIITNVPDVLRDLIG